MMKYCLTSALLLLSSIVLQAQIGYDNHWHFGTGMSLDFSSGSPVLSTTASLSTPTGTEPASLSAASGELLAYTDGISVYNSIGDIVENGTFDETAVESIFCLIPGQSDHYFLFRSSAEIGVTWTIIDMSANDGAGLILDDEKEMEIQTDIAHLMVTSHANQQHFWLVIADNNNSVDNVLDFNSYLIDDSDITLESQFSANYAWAGFLDNFLEDARMSPSCVKIATSHKGHYVTQFEFDNSTGEVTTGFDVAVDLPGSFSNLDFIDFSATGDFLYVLRDGTIISRYDANTFNPVDFQASEESLFTSDAEYSHIKRGPDENMYLLRADGTAIAVIEGADSDEPTLVEEAVVLEESNVEFFPNTMNSCQAQPAAVVSNSCEGDTTLFNSFLPVAADSLYWVIMNGVSVDTVFDLTQFSQLHDIGEYEVEFHYLIDNLWTMLPNAFTVFQQPYVDLGPDISACQGDVIDLSVGETPFNVVWNTGEMTPFIDVTNTATYTVTIVNGLCSAFDEVEVDFTQMPQSELEDVVICDEIIDVTLDATGEHVDSYIWNTGTVGPELNVSQTGLYSVIVSNECFSDSVDASVTFVIFPESLVDSSFFACGLDTVNVTSAYTQGTVTWSSGDIGPSTSIEDEGTFTVSVDDNGCFFFDEFEVIRYDYVDAETLIAPNVITANADDINDVFRPFVPWVPQENVCSYSTLDVNMKIYNRWGNLIHEGPCLWEGLTENEDLVSGATYFYILDLQSKCLDYESDKRIAGEFEVIR